MKYDHQTGGSLVFRCWRLPEALANLWTSSLAPLCPYYSQSRYYYYCYYYYYDYCSYYRLVLLLLISNLPQLRNAARSTHSLHLCCSDGSGDSKPNPKSDSSCIQILILLKNLIKTSLVAHRGPVDFSRRWRTGCADALSLRWELLLRALSSL